MTWIPGVKLTRRQSLIALSYAATVGPLTFYGCGGGNGNGGTGGAAARKGVKGIAQVPAALAGRIAEMRIYTGVGDAPLAANGTFKVDTLANAPTLATLMLHDKMVLVGFLDAQAATNMLDAAGASTSLIFLAIGGWQFSAEQRQAVIALVAKDPTAASLAKTIADRLAVDPYALFNQDPQIVADLNAAVKILAPGRSAYVRAAGRRATTERVATAANKGGGRATRAGDPPPLLLLTPTELLNGMEAVQDGDLVPGFSIINHERRERRVHVYRIGVVDKMNVQTLYPAAVPIGDTLKVSETQKLSLLNALSDILSATSPWSPIQSGRVPLPIEPNTRKTMYEIVALSPAFSTVEPSFFSESRYGAEAPRWRTEIGDLNEAAFFELAFSLLLEALGAGSLKASESAFAEAIKNVKDFGGNDIASLLLRARGGEPVGASLLAFIRLVVSSDTLSSGYLTAITPIYRIANAQLASDAQLGALKAQSLQRFRSALRVVLLVGLIASALEIGAQVRDLDRGETGNLYRADVYVPAVLIAPTSASINAGESVTLTSSVPGAAGASLLYSWTMAGATLANLRDTLTGMVGTSFETKGSTVVLATTPSTQGTITVTVEAFNVAGGARNSLGTAVSTISLKKDIVPGQVKIEFRALNPGSAPLTGETRTMPVFDTPALQSYKGNPVVTELFSNLRITGGDDAFKVAMWFDTPMVKPGTQIQFGPGKNSEIVLKVLDQNGKSVTFTPVSGTLTVVDVSDPLEGGLVTFKLEASMKTSAGQTADIVVTGGASGIQKL